MAGRQHHGHRQASSMAYSLSLLCFCMGVALLLTISVDATQYDVGGAAGWNSTKNANYTHWASQYTFQVNDTLFFKYDAGNDSVLQVNASSFGTCNTAVSSGTYFYSSTGNTTFTFSEIGPYWFISGVGDHCSKGNMKFNVTVKPSSPPPPAHPSSPSPSPSQSDATTNTLAIISLLPCLFFLTLVF